MEYLPKSVRVNTGKQQPVYEKINQFFDSVQCEVEKRVQDSPGPSNFETRVLGLHRPRPTVVPLDDMLHILLYKERVVASVTETRTESNYIQFDFFKNLEGIVKPKDKLVR